MKSGSTEIDNIDNRQLLMNDCMHTIRNLTEISQGSEITTDIDAFSLVVIISDTINNEIKSSLEDLLFIFGTRLSSIKIPNMAIGGDKPDSIFGSSRNIGCQHLHSKMIGDLLTSSETQVIHSPVKIAVHHSCREKILSYLCEYPQQYPMKLAKNRDICFDPTSSANTPPYGVIVDSLIKCCYVHEFDKHILHIADIGTRHRLDVNCITCPVLDMFEKVKMLRKIAGVRVEISQLDVAFNIPTKNSLIQWSYEKLDQSRRKKKMPLLSQTVAEVWALHGIKTTSGAIEDDGKQAGTVRLKQSNWKTPRKIIFPLKPHNANMPSSESDDSTYMCQNTTTTSLTFSNESNSSRITRNISTDAKSLYSIKFYSTISHALTQNRRDLPLTYKKMENLPSSTMEQLKRLFQKILENSRAAFMSVKNNGICARLEVSVRPSGSNDLGDSLRCHGHFIDMMIHVNRSIQECFLSGQHKLTIRTIPCDIVYSKLTSLISQAQSLTSIRASIKYSAVHPGEKCAVWLKALLTSILCIGGLAGETKLKYLRIWMKDEERYNPINIMPTMLTSIYSDSQLVTPVSLNMQPKIQDRTWALIASHLCHLRFSSDCIGKIMYVLKSSSPSTHSRKLYQELSFMDKWKFAHNVRERLIPILVSYLNKGKKLGAMKSVTQHNSLELSYQEHINSSVGTIFIPSHLAYSTDALHQFQDHSASLHTNKRVIPENAMCMDPMLSIITSLYDLSLLFDVHTPIFAKHMYHHISLCHAMQIKLPNSQVNLDTLDKDSSDLDFGFASTCILESICDNVSFHLICKGLHIDILDCQGYSDDECLLASICKHYHFPCQLQYSIPQNLASLQKADIDMLNHLTCEAIRKDIVLQLDSQLFGKRHYYRFHDDCHIWIPNTSFMYLKENNVVMQYTEIYQSSDLYVVLDKIFNNHGYLGYNMRTNLYCFLRDLSLFGSVCDSFLNVDATNNTNFCHANTLEELQHIKNFALVEQFNSQHDNMWNMRHEVILPCVALYYKTNIFIIDKDKHESHLHIYDSSASKVVTHSIMSINRSISPSLKCDCFMKDDDEFKIIQMLPPLSRTIQTCQLFFLHDAKKYSSFNGHPRQRVRKANSVSDSILKILSSDNVKHEHFVSKHDHNDPLDILNYYTEFNSSYPKNIISNFFSDNIASCMATNGIISTSSLLSKISIDYKRLPHMIICPLVCLKYKLWIAVWGDSAEMNEKSEKATFFYGYDARHHKVVCEEVKDHYIHLPFQSHIFYIKSTGTNNFGWWQQEDINPFTYPNYNFSPAKNLTCRYSYLDTPQRNKILSWFQKKYRMRIFDPDLFCSDPNNFYNSPTITLVPVPFYNNLCKHSFQHGLLVIYPFDENERTLKACLIGDNVTNDATFNLKQKLMQLAGPSLSIDDIQSQPNVAFCSTFLLMVYIYIAHSSKNLADLILNIAKLENEIEVDHKSKSWLASLLSDLSITKTSIPIPQWLHQIANTTESQSAETIGGITPTPRKRHLITGFPSASNPNKIVSSKKPRWFSNSALQPLLSDEWSINFSDDLDRYITLIKLKADHVVTSEISTSSSLDTGPLSFKTNKDYVSIFCDISISARELQSLLNNECISHSIVNFIFKIIQHENKTIHYSSHFMDIDVMKPENIQYFHGNIPTNVEYLFILINHGSQRWLLLRLDFMIKKIIIMHSSTNDIVNQKYVSSVKMYIDNICKDLQQKKKTRNTSCNISKWVGNWTSSDASVDFPQSENINDSGLFIILQMSLFLSNYPNSFPAHTPKHINTQKIREKLSRIIFDFTDWEKLYFSILEENDSCNLDIIWKNFLSEMFQQRHFRSQYN